MKLKGQSLIEVLISLGLVVILAVALITASLITQKTARSARNDTQASKLAQENIEEVRVIADRQGFSYLSGKAGSTCWSIPKPDYSGADWANNLALNGSCPSVNINGIDFTPKITLTNSGANVQVQVVVSWTDSGGNQSVTDTTIISDCKSKICPSN